MHTIALTNQKGGVGKTTLTLGLATALAARSQRVLVIDTDPQASATRVTGVDPTTHLSYADVLLEPDRHSLPDALVPLGAEWGFTLAPGEIALANKDRSRWPADEFTLQTALTHVEAAFDVVLLDCPPSLGVLTLNAFTAADQLLVVTSPSFLALQGLRDLLDTHDLVRQYYNPDLALAGVIVNAVERTTEHTDRVHELEQFFGYDLVWHPYLRKRTVVQEAAGKRVPIASLGTYKDAHRTAHELNRLADKVVTTHAATVA